MRSIILAAALCRLAQPAQAAAAGDDRAAVVAKLDGEAVVTEAGLSDWQASQACYGEGAITSRNAGLMRLLEAAIAEKAMRQAGVAALTDADLAAEAARIDRETRAPDILECIKKTLEPGVRDAFSARASSQAPGGAGEGKERYLAAFVRPTLVESRLRTFLIQDSGVQADPRRRIQDVLARLSKKASMESAAKEAALAYSSSTYAVEAPSETSIEPGRMPWSPFEKDFIEKYLKGLKAGQLRKEPIETDYDFRGVRLLKTDGKKWTFESVYAPKVSQEDWFKSAPKMKLEISDEGLRQWVKGIKGNPRLAAAEVK
ncbi:MAG: hypothetical protein HY922_10535 [Elusimicrobia bacterium]|nr:hypothetical protein [Elusimicrobiota bacterium]